MSAMSAPAARRCRRSARARRSLTGSYDIPAATLRSRADLYQHDADERLPQLGPARSHLCDRAGRRRSGMPARDRGQFSIAPHKSGRAATRCPTRTRWAPATTAAPTRPIWTSQWRSPTGTGLRRAGRPPKRAANCSGSGLPIMWKARSARRASAPRSQSRPKAGSRLSSAPARAGRGTKPVSPRSVGAVLSVPVEAIDLVTGDTDIVSLGGGSHSGRSMRHSATLFAKAAPELIAQGKKVGSAPARHQPRPGNLQRWPVFRAPSQSQLRFSRIGKGGRAPRRRWRTRGHYRQRDARSGISERLCGLRGRGRSRNRPGRDRPLFGRSTMSAAASTR